MHFHDPTRPTLGNGYPKYTDAQGVGIAALQPIYIWPRPNGSWQLTVFVARAPSEYSPRMLTCESLDEVRAVLEEYLEDPELCLRARFDWVYSPPHARPAPLSNTGGKKSFSLEDLGL